MRIDIAALADYASVTGDGKLIMCGAFDRIVAMQLPWRHPTMALVLRAAPDADEPREFTVSARCVDADGNAVLPPMEQRVQLPEEPADARPSANLLFTMNGVQFAQAGRYAFDVFVDGVHTVTVPFEVVAPAPPAEGSVTLQ